MEATTSSESAASLSRSFPQRADRWRLRTRELRFGTLPRLMGIINVTPDSFSDGGHFLETNAAIDQGLKLAAEGADILDVGGESTRPYSTPVTPSEELARVVPVVQGLIEHTDVPVSIDTSKAKVAAEAIAAGAEIVNDVTGLEGDPDMMRVVVDANVGVCAMHMQGTPPTMQDDPVYQDVVEEIHAYLRGRRDRLLASGLQAARICLDPGIGFGKTHQHNLALLTHCERFHQLACTLLVGHSRKGFIGHVLADKHADRTAGTIGVALALARRGIQILRVHDVLVVRQGLQLFEASGGLCSP